MMRRFAMTIGVQDYATGSGVAPLQYACADAQAIGVALREQCRFEEVRILTTASPETGLLTDTSILTALRDMAAKVNEEDLFLFFFAGHGVELRVGGQDRSFLLAPNASLQFMTGLLDLAMVREIMARMACAQRVFLLDCCRNDPHAGRGDSSNMMTAQLTRDIVATAARTETALPNRVTLVMNACRPGERSYERPDVGQGAFSYWIVQGLRGAAWMEGRLEGAQLCHYVQSKLTEWSARTGLNQHADFQQLESAAPVFLAQGHRPEIAPASPLPTAPVRPSKHVQLPIGGSAGMECVHVESGEFRMGAAEDDVSAFDNERPVRRVRITEDYWIARRPVTVSQWTSVMVGDRPPHGAADAPKTETSWDDAQEFLFRWNEQLVLPAADALGQGRDWVVRLPTEAEWEFALATEGHAAWPDWIGHCWQWCEDWFGPYGHGLAIDPTGPREGMERVLRGASWRADRRFFRPTARGHRPPNARQDDIGFRIVLARRPLENDGI